MCDTADSMRAQKVQLGCIMMTCQHWPFILSAHSMNDLDGFSGFSVCFRFELLTNRVFPAGLSVLNKNHLGD